MSRLKEKYKEYVIPSMIEEFKYKSIMAVPRLKKVVLNMGLGEAIFNKPGDYIYSGTAKLRGKVSI